jgi:hypothetical protein
LLGYDNQQLKDGAADRLVDDLGNPRVEFRILAIENLQRMTQKTYMYGPVLSERIRSSKITKWRSDLKGGKIAVLSSPADYEEWRRLSSPTGS